MTQEFMRSCENCLFYVDVMPSTVICLGHKRIKEFARIKTNCDKWLENTKENATIVLNKIKKEQ